MSNVPLELYSHILDCLSDDHSSLKALSLVCSRLTGSSQRLLFSDITLKGNSSISPSTPTKRLVKILVESPHLASLIKRLFLICDSFGSRLAPIEQDHYLSTICQILHIHRSLLCLSFHGPAGVGAWGLIPPSNQQAIIALLGTPSLQSISLSYAPIQLLSHFSESVQHVDIAWLQVEERSDLPFPSCKSGQFIPAQLRSLRMKACKNDDFITMYRALSAYRTRLSRLEKLLLWVGGEGMSFCNEAVNQLVSSCSQTLQVLAIEMSHFSQVPLASARLRLDLKDTTQLQRLHIHYKTAFCESKKVDHLLELAQVLSTAPSPSALETVQLTLSIYKLKSLSHMQVQPWTVLDTTLSDPCRFPRLRRLTVAIAVQYSPRYRSRAPLSISNASSPWGWDSGGHTTAISWTERPCALDISHHISKMLPVLHAAGKFEGREIAKYLYADTARFEPFTHFAPPQPSGH